MTREEAVDLILKTGSGPPQGSPRHRELMQFLETCSETQTLYEQQRAVWGALELWEPVEPSAQFDRRLRERVDELANREPWYLRTFATWRPTFAVGLAALLIAAVGVVQQRPEAAPGTELAVVEPLDDEVYLEQLNRALDDIEMLADFDVMVDGTAQDES